MPDYAINGFRGLMKNNYTREFEKENPAALIKAENVTIGDDGNLYVHTGFQRKSGYNSMYPIDCIFYSEVLSCYVICGNGNILTFAAPGNRAVSETADNGHNGVYTSGTKMCFAEWPLTSVVYILGGGVLLKLSGTNGDTIDDITGDVPSDVANGTVIHAFKSTMFVANGTKLYPSASLDPESFDTVDELNCLEGGYRINALCGLNGVLYAHKDRTIYSIVGNEFAGEAKDVSKMDLNTEVGAVHRFAVCTYNQRQWFIGYDGFYTFDGQTATPIHNNLRAALNFNRAVGKYEDPL